MWCVVRFVGQIMMNVHLAICMNDRIRLASIFCAVFTFTSTIQMENTFRQTSKCFIRNMHLCFFIHAFMHIVVYVTAFGIFTLTRRMNTKHTFEKRFCQVWVWWWIMMCRLCRQAWLYWRQRWPLSNTYVLWCQWLNFLTNILCLNQLCV